MPKGIGLKARKALLDTAFDHMKDTGTLNDAFETLSQTIATVGDYNQWIDLLP